MAFNVYFSKTGEDDAKAHITRLENQKAVKEQLRKDGKPEEKVIGFMSVGGNSGTRLLDLTTKEELRLLEQILTEVWCAAAKHGALAMFEETEKRELERLKEDSIPF